MDLHQQDSTTISPTYAESSTPEQSANASPPTLVAPEKPRVWTVFLAFATMLTVGLIATGIYLVVAAIVTGGVSGDPRAITQRAIANPNIIIPSFAIMGITALIVTAICCGLSPERVWDRLSLRSNRFGARGYVAAIAMVYGTSMAAGQLIQPFTDTKSPTLKLIDGHLRSANSFMFALAVAIIAGLAPVAEEVFFRGYVQTRLRRRWGSAWAIGITALAFGAFHLDPIQSPVAMVIGVALGYVADRSGSIRPAIVCHILNNMLAVMVTKLPESQHDQSTSWPAFAAGIIVSASGVMWFRRQEKRINLDAVV